MEKTIKTIIFLPIMILNEIYWNIFYKRGWMNIKRFKSDMKETFKESSKVQYIKTIILYPILVVFLVISIMVLLIIRLFRWGTKKLN